MKLDIPATRMELLKLKKRLPIAYRGHKLLKDKLDELIHNMMDLAERVRELRWKVDKEIATAFGSFYFAQSRFPQKELQCALLAPMKKVEIKTEFDQVLNVRIPRFEKKVEGTILSYGFLKTSGDLDISTEAIDRVLEHLLELAALEKRMELIAIEIEKTRRRVNALEFVLIPAMEETIKYITQKFAEFERGNLTRIMRVQEKIRR
ncbi:MAG TPA: V-type ATP synthase subunit D [bacterium (Candidatus Stahlbacteria)]|nr:V-type ATP synthase subunit D [Candidatus Stahlbacteria bacterium]